MACLGDDGSPVLWDRVQGGGEGLLSLTDHMCLLCHQEPAATFGNTSAHPTTAASTTNAWMTACAWKVSPGFSGTTGGVRDFLVVWLEGAAVGEPWESPLGAQA
jgi:hypothetical protein